METRGLRTRRQRGAAGPDDRLCVGPSAELPAHGLRPGPPRSGTQAAGGRARLLAEGACARGPRPLGRRACAPPLRPPRSQPLPAREANGCGRQGERGPCARRATWERRGAVAPPPLGARRRRLRLRAFELRFRHLSGSQTGPETFLEGRVGGGAGPEAGAGGGGPGVPAAGVRRPLRRLPAAGVSSFLPVAEAADRRRDLSTVGPGGRPGGAEARGGRDGSGGRPGPAAAPEQAPSAPASRRAASPPAGARPGPGAE